jgi:hypothetical protein
MRSVLLPVGISLDVCIARLNGAVDFLFMPKDYSMSSFLASVDTSIMGRKTLDAGIKMSGGSLPRSNMRMHVVSKSKTIGRARRRPLHQRNACHFHSQTPQAFRQRWSG